ncbi:MAG: cysteine--tRNA ligase [Rickettsiaceae bacterium]|nr:cysteine--tRNA ligase [Rickettsiaceae bacterium]
MHLTLFNSLTKRKENFIPLKNGEISMYVCGPTVYDRPHIGNARSVVCYDVLYRLLSYIYGKESVKYVRNITDIDDKIINRAKENNITIEKLTLEITQLFHHDVDYLYCLRPNFEPKATEHIDDIIDIIQRLLNNGYAYIASGHVYFDVSKYQDYAKLSGQTIEELFNSVRIEQSLGKKHNNDFVLWKPVMEEEKFASFNSPFGRGRPGWHIECSAMSYKFLGKNFDIHGGGVDLVFPHHTNEIAQSCAAFPGSQYARYWVHNGFLTVNHEKMSKSLGNFLTIKDLIDQEIKGEVIRLVLMNCHYRKPLDYNDKTLKDHISMLNYWYQALENVGIEFGKENNIDLPDEFIDALCDDLNTHQAISIIHEYAKKLYVSGNDTDKIYYGKKLYYAGKFLGFFNHTPNDWFRGNISSDKIEQLISERAQAKMEKNWQKADKIRQTLADMNIIIEDGAGKTTWKKKQI